METIKQFENFSEQLKRKLYKSVGTEARIDIHETTKNNGITYHGLAILNKESNISPNIRLDSFYHAFLDGTSMEEITSEILKIYEKAKKEERIDLGFFTEFNEAKAHILFKVVGYEQNRERMAKIPHIRFLDLALTFYYYLNLENSFGENASIQIENSHMEMWKVNIGQLYDIAMKNTQEIMKPQCRGISDIILEMMQKDGIHPTREDIKEFREKSAEVPMLVLSNEKNYFGASVLYYPGLLDGIAERHHSDLIILPSSIHEGATRFAA